MKKFIISLVFVKITDTSKNFGIAVSSKADQQLDIQNEVYVLSADTPEEAYDRCARTGKLKYPGHRIVARVVVDMNVTPEDELLN